MIRYSQKSDIKDIITLWHEAFGDSESEIMFFLNDRYKPENTLVYEADGRVASVLFLLEGEMQIKGKVYPSYYLYAACTLNKYRGRGYMSYLLDFAKGTAVNRGYYFICLLPGEKSLYDYYEKFGYKAVFKKKLLTLRLNDLNSDSLITNETINNIEEVRNKAFKNYDMFKWDSSALNFAFKHNSLYGGQAITSCKDYALYNTFGRKIHVKEITFTGDFEAVCLHILSHSDRSDELIVHLPAEYETSIGKYEIIDSGMILAVNNDAEKIMNKISNAYLGLTLD